MEPLTEFAEEQNTELIELLLEYFITTTNIFEEAKFLEEHPQLLDDEVLKLLDWLTNLDYKLDSEETANLRRIIGLRKQFLKSCIINGIETALKQEQEREQLFQVLHEFFTVPNWPTSKCVVEQHLELLNPQVDQMLRDLIEAASESGDQSGKQLFEQSQWLLSQCRQFGSDATYAMFEDDEIGPATFELFKAPSNDEYVGAMKKLNSEEGENRVKQAIFSARDQISEDNLLPMEQKYREIRLIRALSLVTETLFINQNVEEIIRWIDLYPEILSSEFQDRVENALAINMGGNFGKALLETLLKMLQTLNKPGTIVENRAHEFFQILQGIGSWPTPPVHAEMFFKFIWVEDLETAILLLQEHPELLSLEANVYKSFAEKLEHLEPAWSIFMAFYSQRMLERIGLLLDCQKIGFEAACNIWRKTEPDRQILVPHLGNFLEAKSLWQSRRILNEHPEILSPDALTLLSNFAHGASNYGVELDVQKCTEYYDLLKQCLNSDIDTEFAAHPQRMIEYYRTARLTANSEKQRAAMQHRLGRAYQAIGKQSEAVAVYRDALSFYDPVKFPAECYEIALDLAESLINKSQAEESALVLTLALIAAELRYYNSMQKPLRPLSEIVKREEYWLKTCIHWAHNSTELLANCVELARGTGANYTFGSLSFELGVQYGQSDQPEKAIQPLEEALVIFRIFPDSYRRSMCLMNLALAKYATKQFREAEKLLLEALDIAGQVGEDEQRLDIFCRLGDIYAEIKDYSQAEEYLLKAKKGYQELGLLFGEAACAGRLGDIYLEQGRFREADQWHDIALQLTQLGHQRQEETASDDDTNTKIYESSYREWTGIPPEAMLLASGNAEFQLGRFQEALEHYQAALRLVRNIRNFQFEALVLGNLGNVHSRLGQHGLAIETYNQALELNRKIGNKLGEAKCLGNLGLVYFILRNLPKAVENYEAAESIYNELGEVDVTNIAMLANAYHAMGKEEIAFRCQNKALKLARKTANIEAEASCLINLAAYYHNKNELDKVQQLYRQALNLFNQSGNLIGQFNCLSGLAEICSLRDDFKQTFSYYYDALKLTDIIRGPLVASAHRFGITTNRFDIHRDAVTMGLKSGSDLAAFEVLELSKARWLSDQLVRRNMLPSDHPLYEEYIRRSDILDAASTALATKTTGWLTLPHPEHLGEASSPPSFEQALADFNSVVKLISEKQPELSIIYGVGLDDVEFKKLQSALPNDKTAFVEFAIGNEQTTIFVVLAKQKIPQIINIPNLPQDYLEFLVGGRYGTPATYGSPTVGYWISSYLNKSRDKQAWFETLSLVLNELGELIWSELDILLKNNGIEQVIFIPQGPLFMLPLHAAPIGGSGGVIPLERYSIAYAPSVLIYQELRRKRHLQTINLNPLVIGNPTDDLDFATVETLAINTILNIPPTRLLQKKQAIRSNFLNLANDAGIIHFAGHGVYEWGNSSNSGLLLASDGKSDRLTLSEIRYHLRLRQANLVVLSACETNIIESGNAQTDEYLGLPAAILLAGASAVIGSLWSVQDLSTALLMERFYSELLTSSSDGKLGSPAEALRRAQLWLYNASRDELISRFQRLREELIENGATTEANLIRTGMAYIRKSSNAKPFGHPFYWAAFQAVGDVL